jgi:dihydropteroate synthase
VCAGADVINDISGGVYDEKILSVAHHYQVPIVLMHMRGYIKSPTHPPTTKAQAVVTDGASQAVFLSFGKCQPQHAADDDAAGQYRLWR